MSAALRISGATLSGALLALCFVPFDQSWLVWGWLWLLLPLLWTVKSKRSRLRGFGLAYLAGFAFWAINLKWLGTVTWPGVFVFAGYLAIYFGAFGAFAARSANPWRETLPEAKSIPDRFRQAGRSLGYAALLGGFWCGLEWIRGWMLSGFGWNGLGVTFAKNLILAQNAEYVGVIGLSFLPVFFSAVVVQTARRFYQQSMKGGVKLLHWDFATALLVVMSAFTLGTIRLTSVTNQPKLEARALLVQQDIPQVAGQISWTPSEIVDGFVDLTEKGLAKVEEEAAERLQEADNDVPIPLRYPDLVVWPEACLPYWFEIIDGVPVGGPQMDSIVEYIGGLGNFTFVVGINEVVGADPIAEDSVSYNSMLVRSPEGKRESYQKHHLVYFGETLPDVQLLHDIYEKTAGVPFGGIDRGTNFEPIPMKLRGEDVEIIPSICFEDTVPRLTRKFVRKKPQILVNITNDGWFQESEGAAQHFRNSIFRCIELRRPMLRCANRGVTSIISATGGTIDPYTKQRRRLEDENGSHFHRGSLLASAYLLKDGRVTLYAAFGDWFAVTGLIVGLLWGLIGIIRSAQKRRASRAA